MLSEPLNLALPPFTSSGALDIFHNALNFLSYKVGVKIQACTGETRMVKGEDNSDMWAIA